MNVTKSLLISLGTNRAEFDFMMKGIVALLERSDHAVEQAIVRIHDRQTKGEKNAMATVEDNGIGFQACDARRGTYWARLVLGGRHLFADRMPKARKMTIKYRAQLTVLAFEKRQRAERERQARLDRMSDLATFSPEDLEAEMMRVERPRATARSLDVRPGGRKLDVTQLSLVRFSPRRGTLRS